MNTIEMTSTAFEANGEIPTRYTCEGADLSPPLSWEGVPDEAETLALIVEDPDAPTQEAFVHWVVYNVDASSTGVDEGQAPAGAVEGANDFGNVGYGGPCPPPGDGSHRYFFRLFAASQRLGLEPGATAAEVREALAEITVARGELIGTYERG